MSPSIKHFVIIRFYPFQDPNFTQDIFDLKFIDTQLTLAKDNVLPSLENQTNKSFEIVFLANEKYFADKKYDVIFSTLKKATVLPVTFINYAEGGALARLIGAAYNKFDYVIQSRIDFDDFIHKGAIADTQSKVEECDRILSYGYCRGYTYLNGELYPYYETYDGVGHLAMLQSLMLKSSFAKTIPFVGVYSLGHTKAKTDLEKILERQGIQFVDSMFQQNLTTDAFIYFRHDATYSHKGQPMSFVPGYIRRHKKLTAKDITKRQLEEDFAFHYELKSIV